MIYLDHAATSPLRPAARDAMAPWLEQPANPASVHAAGQRAAAAVEHARAQVAALVGRPVEGIVFTSGATEANHQAIRGLAALGARSIAVSRIEHPSVHGVISAAGLEILECAVAPTGQVRVPPPSADVLCLMVANHETGVLQPVEGAEAWVGSGRSWHADATQALGKVPLDALVGATTVALSAHKIGGPAGVGALSLLGRGSFPALFPGGTQERGRRAGTLNVAGIVGFGAAAAEARATQAARHTHWGALSDRLEAGLRAAGARVVGSGPVLPSHRCVVFDGLSGELLVQLLDVRGVATSSGAACASGSVEPSPVLCAMGDVHPSGALRFSLGPDTTLREVEEVLAMMPEVVAAARLAT